MRETVRRLAPIATKLLENKVYLRFINYELDGSGNFDNIDPRYIGGLIDDVGVSGGTQIGTNLARKIVNRLIEELKSPSGLDRPVVVTIITDGEVCFRACLPLERLSNRGCLNIAKF